MPLLIAALCFALQFAGLSDTLRFDRALIEAGHWWLLLTCNFVHLGESHLFMNMAGLALVYFLLWPNFSASEWLLITLVGALGVGIGLYLFNPELHRYVGFSGTQHGMILAGAIADMRRYPKSSGALTLIVIAKLIWEQLYGSVPGSADMAGGNVVVDSHWYGAISGVVCLAVLLGIKRLGNHKA